MESLNEAGRRAVINRHIRVVGRLATPWSWPNESRPTVFLCSGARGVKVRICRMALVGNAGQPLQEDRLRSPPVRSAEVDASIYAQVLGQDMLESAA